MKIELRCRFTNEICGYIDRPDIPDGAIVRLEDLDVADVRSPAAEEEHGRFSEIDMFLRDHCGKGGDEVRDIMTDTNACARKMFEKIMPDDHEKIYRSGFESTFPHLAVQLGHVETKLGIDDLPDREAKLAVVQKWRTAHKKAKTVSKEALAEFKQ